MMRNLLVAAAASSIVIGCGMSGEPELGGEELGETEQLSVGDAACATAAPLLSPDGRNDPIQAEPNCGITNQVYTSPNTSYDWTPNACGHTYISQITGTTGRAFNFVITDGGPALNADSCPLVAIHGAAHGLRVADGLWHFIGETVWHGEWVAGPLFSYCNFVKDPGSSTIPAATGIGTKNYSRVRVEGISLGFIFKRQVRVGISYGPGPC